MRFEDGEQVLRLGIRKEVCIRIIGDGRVKRIISHGDTNRKKTERPFAVDERNLPWTFGILEPDRRIDHTITMFVERTRIDAGDLRN